MSEFVLPNLGDGVAQGDVLKVLVKPGDAIKVDQPVLELETDKATVEVPSTLAGVVKEIRVKAYDRNGERIELHAQNFSARVIQHENDHLDGVLFFDRMKGFETLTFLDEYSRYWVKDDEE